MFIDKTLDALEKYLRLEVIGTEKIPPDGKFICVANHSGIAGLDALILAHEIKKVRKKQPQILAHKLWFHSAWQNAIQKQFGLIRADFNSSLLSLNNGDALILFPEGEGGNFKPTKRRYRLQDFRGGFARAALITGSPILPCVIIGAEETHINLGRITFLKKIIGTDIPLPLNLLPLPIKWKIMFFDPVYIEGHETDALNAKRIQTECTKMRHFLQAQVVEELRQRKAINIGKVSISDDDIP